MKDSYINKDGCDVRGYAYVSHLATIGSNLYLINQIYVVPKYRGQGVATDILTRIINDADAEGARLILDFQPAEFNSDAVRLQLFYERFEFAWDERLGGMRREPRINSTHTEAPVEIKSAE